MRLAIAVFTRRDPRGAAHAAGFVFVPAGALGGRGAALGIAGTLAAGLTLHTEPPPGAETTRLIAEPNTPMRAARVRLALRERFIGFAVPAQRKGWWEGDGAPARGVLRLPALGPADFAWRPQVTQSEVRQRTLAERAARETGRAAAVAARAAGATPAAIRAVLRRQLPAEMIGAPHPPATLIDLGDLMGAVAFVNEALATGLVVPRLADGGALRLALALKGAR